MLSLLVRLQFINCIQNPIKSSFATFYVLLVNQKPQFYKWFFRISRQQYCSKFVNVKPMFSKLVIFCIKICLTYGTILEATGLNNKKFFLTNYLLLSSCNFLMCLNFFLQHVFKSKIMFNRGERFWNQILAYQYIFKVLDISISYSFIVMIVPLFISKY